MFGKHLRFSGLSMGLLLMAACASLQAKENLPVRYWQETIFLNKDNIPDEVRAHCGLLSPKTTSNFPKLILVSSDTLENMGLEARYNRTKTEIEYINGREKALIHEYQHHFNSNLTRDCVDEVSAYFAEALYDREQEIAYLKRLLANRHSKSLITIRRMRGNQ